MNAKDKILEQAVAQQDVPFVVAMAANGHGVTYSGAAGEAAPGRKAAEHAVFRIFSMTKAVGSTAAMILVDRGKLDPDAPVEETMPEFAKVQVLDGWDGDKPRLRAPKTKVTARHLATHTSGLEYPFWSADMANFEAKTSFPSLLTGQRAALYCPMMVEPGTRWGYGIGIDWLGELVEKIDGRRVDKFVREEILQPLGMNDTDFEPNAKLSPRLAAVAMRGEDGNFGPFDLAPPPNSEVYGMGHALYSTAPDYMTFLRMFLNRGALNGKRVLSEEAIDRMLNDHMNGLTLTKMPTAAPPITADFEPFAGTKVTHSFGFMRNEEDIPGMRSAGSQSWAGVLNTHYWFDLKKNVAAVIMTQTLPFVEPRYMQLYGDFEKAVYAEM